MKCDVCDVDVTALYAHLADAHGAMILRLVKNCRACMACLQQTDDLIPAALTDHWETNGGFLPHYTQKCLESDGVHRWASVVSAATCATTTPAKALFNLGNS